jgi:hypothetical protein
MRLTSRQKSGPHSAIVRLIRTRPFPLALKTLPADKNEVVEFITRELGAIQGMRDYNKASGQFATNLLKLESGAWSTFLELCNGLRTDSTSTAERQVAHAVTREFIGFGPKQSRNFLQALGLTRFEIPLDSRIMRWLRETLRFPLPIGSAVLQDPEYYDLVLDHLQALCKDAEVFPCMLDAAIFSDSDDDVWDETAMDF